jgi:hypothetical protein
MSNHSSDPQMMEEISKFMGLGETGKFPQGKLHPTDEGELKMAITTQDNRVLIAFGKPTAWVGMDKQQAILFANTIIEKASHL